jgi:hypothetical protein
MAKVQFNNDEFRRSHGKEPKGRGSWAFGNRPGADPCSDDQCVFSPGGMSLAEARRWVSKRVEEGKFLCPHNELWVLP